MRTWLEVDLGLVKKNIETVKSVLPEDCSIIAVVKANAYGHGDAKIALALMRLGIRHFAVACIDEAAQLRNAGLQGEIIVLGYTDPADVMRAVEMDITLACVSRSHFKELFAAAQEAEKPLKIHLAINTGMNRIGFDCRTPEQLARIYKSYMAAQAIADHGSKVVDICGIFSHFSSSDDTSEGADPYTQLQLERFNMVLDFLAEKGIDPGLRHISNSGAIGKYPQARFDAVRCGALLYGYNTAMDAKLPVEPVMEWKTRDTCVRTIERGDAVSYSRRFIANKPTVIATLGIGYADGLSRSLSNKGYVLINGYKVPIVGNICMDQMMVDVTEIQALADAHSIPFAVARGTEAVIIGRSGRLVQTADDIAEACGSCMHEVLSTIGLRVERYYK